MLKNLVYNLFLERSVDHNIRAEQEIIIKQIRKLSENFPAKYKNMLIQMEDLYCMANDIENKNAFWYGFSLALVLKKEIRTIESATQQFDKDTNNLTGQFDN